MSRTAPTPLTPATTAPTIADPSTFEARMDARLGWQGTNVTESNALATINYDNAVDCYNNALASAVSDAASAASAVQSANSAIAAAASAGATAWVNGGTYAQNVSAISQINFRAYRKITASSVTTIDPSIDPTNWTPSTPGLSQVTVTGTTQTAVSGISYVLTNVAATAVTAPAVFDGAEFAVVPGNGLLTNTVDFGAATVIGAAGSLTGVVTLNLGVPLHVVYSSTLTKWVVI